MFMESRKDLARQALRAAIALRRKLQIPRTSPLCAVDCTTRLGLDVWYTGGSSFSGMYEKSSQTILVPALRPIGYQSFTCAHELAHWYFKHGTRVDETDSFVGGDASVPEERLANLFAGSFIMPIWAVKKAFEDRHWTMKHCTPFQAYVVATYMGVGYSALVQHMRWSLDAITATRCDALLRVTPKQIREEILGNTDSKHLVVACNNWQHVAIDLRVGDMAILPLRSAFKSASLERVSAHELGVLAVAVAPGITQVRSTDDWTAFARVSRQEYRGPSEYRHFEDPDFDEEPNVDSRGQSVARLG